MSWCVHDDKWPVLKNLAVSPSLTALDAFNPAADIPANDQHKAADIIHNRMISLSDDAQESFAGEVLHASNLIFARAALSTDGDATNKLIAGAFKHTAKSSLRFYSSLKQSILAACFDAAKYGESEEQERGITLFDILGKSDPAATKEFLENYTDQKWSSRKSLRDILPKLDRY